MIDIGERCVLCPHSSLMYICTYIYDEGTENGDGEVQLDFQMKGKNEDYLVCFMWMIRYYVMNWKKI